MAKDQIHLNDIGTKFEVTIKDGTEVVDISGATTKSLLFLPPKGIRVTQAGTFSSSNGIDGVLTYTSVSGDLNEAGTWKLQAFVKLSGGTWSSDIIDFEVYPILPASQRGQVSQAITEVNRVKEYIGIPEDNTASDNLLVRLVNRATDMIESYCGRIFRERTYLLERYTGDGTADLYLNQWPVTTVERVAVGTLNALKITNSDSTAYSAVAQVTPTLIKLEIHGGSNDGTQERLFTDSTSLSAMATQIDTYTSWAGATVSSDFDNHDTTELIPTGARETLNTSIDLLVPDQRLTDYDVNLDAGTIHRASGWSEAWNNIYVNYTAGYAVIPDDLEQIAIEVTKELFNKRKIQSGLKSEKIGNYSYTAFDNQSDKSPVMDRADDLAKYRRVVYA